MYTNILAALDLKEDGYSEYVLDAAIKHGMQGSSTVHLLSVATNGGTDDLQSQLADFCKNHPNNTDVVINQFVDEGKPVERILHWAEETKADLIVIAIHKEQTNYLGKSSASLGTVPAMIAVNAKAHVLIVKPH